MSLLSWLHRPPSVRIEPLSVQHAPPLAGLQAQAFARPWGVVEFESLLSDRSVVADGLFLGRSSEPQGFVLSRQAADEAEILSLALAPEIRGHGYAGQLLAHHLDELNRRAVRTVHLEVEDGNAPALALYRRAGFREVGRRPGYYAKPDGSRATALTMSLALA